MASVSAAFPRVASFFLFASLAVTSLVRADDLTGMAQDDPQDLYPAPAAQTPSYVPCYNSGFLPLPSWARGVVMPPLPDVLTPMGKKVVLTTPPVPAPVAQTPADSETRSRRLLSLCRSRPSSPAPNPAFDCRLALPRLDQGQSRRPPPIGRASRPAHIRRGAMRMSPSSTGTTPAPNATPNTTAAPRRCSARAVLDAAAHRRRDRFGTGTTTGSSAAIYSTPQR